ncbi:MAG: hypothetical protein GY850_19910 [bacterium]|nr:hypothetical protein [bacterium]
MRGGFAVIAIALAVQDESSGLKTPARTPNAVTVDQTGPSQVKYILKRRRIFNFKQCSNLTEIIQGLTFV